MFLVDVRRKSHHQTYQRSDLYFQSSNGTTIPQDHSHFSVGRTKTSWTTGQVENWYVDEVSMETAIELIAGKAFATRDYGVICAECLFSV